MNDTDLTLVIRCASDSRVFDCIESVDENVEIVVTTIPDPGFEDKLKDAGASVCTSPPGNLSVASNAGIAAASNDLVFLTDSDTVLRPGCLATVRSELKRYRVVNARIDFLSDGTEASRKVAAARHFVNSKELAFTPGLGFDRQIADDIGGFIFDDKVPFAVDANLDFRIKAAGIPVSHGSGAAIIHSVESVEHDMVAARRIGAGVAVGADMLSRMYPDRCRRDIRRALKAVHCSDYPRIASEHGLSVLLYQMRWDLNFYLGRSSA